LSTDEILAGGSRVLPFRSNIHEISEFTFERVDETYTDDAKELKEKGGHMVVGGYNYAQGSSREHAALAPRYLGLRVVLVKDYARIHRQNLINFGILPLAFVNDDEYEFIEDGAVLEFRNTHENIRSDETFQVV